MSNSQYTRTLKLVIDNQVISEYNKYYFKKYPRRKKEPIPSPHHPSINQWMIMKRPMMNALKQKWKEFVIWFVEENGLANKSIDKCEIIVINFFRTRNRRDVDNIVPKFILDGLVEGGLIVDDDYNHVESLTLKCGYDKENPRTEVYIYY